MKTLQVVLIFCSMLSILYFLVDFHLLSDHKSATKNIFFIETSGASSLNFRQVCAIESTARHNPSMSITVLLFTKHQVMNEFSNVQMRSTTFEEIFEGTPLEDWYFQRKWNNSVYKVYHLSDAVRYAVIWKHGGIYLDLDIIMLKSLPSFSNFVIKERANSICNGIFGMQRNHSLLYNCMKDFVKVYKSNCFACVGPTLFTKHFVSFCGEKNVDVVEKRKNCNVNILNPISAFPVSYRKWKDYFTNSKSLDIIEKMNNSYMIHVWNKFSSKRILHLNSGSAYEIAMTRNCPTAYTQAIKSGDKL
ncbi:lactosylceramide 4-alpha-galactosyltransferase-like [Centruroides vittatus]|uniref:lactosylceramide 4-alpha-galactosyltransferase-like n=1 Tax=Centruroides vittatus TaxID=120091 RepID=UPI00350EB08C